MSRAHNGGERRLRNRRDRLDIGWPLSTETLIIPFVSFVSFCSKTETDTMHPQFHFYEVKLVDGISRLLLPGANQT
jgi:hypothetical protein